MHSFTHRSLGRGERDRLVSCWPAAHGGVLGGGNSQRDTFQTSWMRVVCSGWREANGLNESVVNSSYTARGRNTCFTPSIYSNWTDSVCPVGEGSHFLDKVPFYFCCTLLESALTAAGRGLLWGLEHRAHCWPGRPVQPPGFRGQSRQAGRLLGRPLSCGDPRWGAGWAQSVLPGRCPLGKGGIP